MGTFIETDVVEHVWRTLRDLGDTATTQLLTDTEIKAFLRQAERRYSLDRPLEVVTDLVGDGTFSTALPATFEEGFSGIRSIEIPAGQNPPAMRDPRGFRIYRAPAGLSLRWLESSPGVGQSIRVTFTRPRRYEAVAANTTVLDADHFAVCDLTSSLCADSLMAKYARSHEPVLSADVTNYRSKQQEWGSIAKRLADRYASHMRLSGGTPAGGSGWTNWDARSSDGRDYLFHRRGIR